MASEHQIAAITVHSKEDSTSQPADHNGSCERKNDVGFGPDNAETGHKPVGTRLGSLLRAFEKQLVEYNLEARGIERVAPEERIKRLSWLSYLQAFLLWVSINLAANNITLGMLGPAVFGLSFLDSALCAVFGSIAGSLVAAWMATWGPISGIRTMVSTHLQSFEFEARELMILGIWSILDGMVAQQDCRVAQSNPDDWILFD